jgi:serine/tyrosine/threonine adenylyltransferase
MLVGFVHGVMNTDNMTISGETIDYGPCAFTEGYDPATVFSSIDLAGRYAYGNQPAVAQWNLARFAETLLPLLDAVPETAHAAATDLLESFPGRYHEYWRGGMRAKLGILERHAQDDALFADLLALLHAQRVDFTLFFRTLPAVLRDPEPARSLFSDPSAFTAWGERWQARLATQGAPPEATVRAMNRVNPVYIPRNHQVEKTLAAATDGDLEPFRTLLDVLSRPFDERPELATFATPAPLNFGPYRTFCGT